jgi:uncharacterized UBP type Zn finger protein
MSTHPHSPAPGTSARPCTHLAAIRPVEPDADSCRRCLAAGQTSTDLWLCLSCGWVSGSLSSRAQPNDEHYAETDHPIAARLAGPRAPRWCFIDQRYV